MPINSNDSLKISVGDMDKVNILISITESCFISTSDMSIIYNSYCTFTKLFKITVKSYPCNSNVFDSNENHNLNNI